MLYKFKSQAAADVIMMEPHATKVLQVLGREPAERGVIQVADMPAAIETLRKAMQEAHDKALNPPPKNETKTEEEEEYDDIPFYARAQPFLDLLKESLAEGKDVVWGV